MLNDCKFVPTLPLPSALMPVLHHVEERQLALWDALYDDRATYVCDRHVAVSAPVYDAVFGRPPADVPEVWKQRVRVLHFDLNEDELLRRLRVRGDAHVDVQKLLRARQEYWKQLYRWGCVHIDAAAPPHHVASVCRRYVCEGR